MNCLPNLIGLLGHIIWLVGHHYNHRALLELHQILWALQHNLCG